MNLQELKKRSRAAVRTGIVSLEAILWKVKSIPGKTPHWHYGRSLTRSKYYQGFDRAVKHGLIKNVSAGKISSYVITDLGEEYLKL